MKTREKGKWGEKVAVDYLRDHGLTIVDVNYYSRWGEIDIIANDDTFILFVEVKLRKENSLVAPGESVVKSKQKKIIKTAHHYLLNNQISLQPRFDVIEIRMLGDREVKVNHIKNAFWQEETYSNF